ncbi:MAG: glycosyltransferase family 4 protein [Actinomycetota bacterium]
MRLVVVTPHFAPDVAPTGEVVSRITRELVAQDHRVEVITSLPWYRDHRIEPGYGGKLVRYEDVPWGRIVRVNPFPAPDKGNIARRAVSFAGFSFASAVLGGRGEPVDGVLALSPPLTLGLTGWAIARRRSAPLVFNIQDVYPDVAVELGVLTNARLVSAAHRLERLCYARADAVTVLGDDLKENISTRVNHPSKVRVIPNFVDTEWIAPAPRTNEYRKQHGLSDKFVVMYAGNVGLSQSLDLVIDAAAALAHEKEMVFVINGGGAAKAGLRRRAEGLGNVVFVDMQPAGRLPEVLAAADVHLVPLKRGLARSSVPSKTYSILAAGRPLIASVDPGSEVARIVERSGGGIAVPPEDPEAFTKAVRSLYEQREQLDAMGTGGRAFAEQWVSPAAVAKQYAELFAELNALRGKEV